MLILLFSLSFFSWAIGGYVERRSPLYSLIFALYFLRTAVFFYSRSAVIEHRRWITGLLLPAIHFSVSSAVPVMSFIQFFFSPGNDQVQDDTVYAVVMSQSAFICYNSLVFGDSNIFFEYKPVILGNFSQLEFECFLMIRFRLCIWG